MEKKVVNLTFKEWAPETVSLVKEIQHKIFPESSFEAGIDMLVAKGAKEMGQELMTYFIAYADGEPCGMFGLYVPNGVEEHHSIWLGWYGILPSFRGRGVGKKILLHSIEKAKEYKSQFPIKYFRLYTSVTTNDSAQPLYNKVMTLKEFYRNEEMFCDAMMQKARAAYPGKTDEEYKEAAGREIAIFSTSLDENEILIPWENRCMNLMRDISFEQDTREAK